LGILAASGQIPADRLDDYEYAGELALGATAAGTRCAGHDLCHARWPPGGPPTTRLHPAPANADEAALVPQAIILPAGSLLDVCAHFTAVMTAGACNATTPGRP
jgi:magnesium chelatase family protein